MTHAQFRTAAGALTIQVHYVYDAQNRLILRRVDAHADGVYEYAWKFVYDGTQAVLVFDVSNAVTNRLLWGPEVDQLFADESSVDGLLWALTDHQGTVRDLVKYHSGTDTTTVAKHLDYDAFGNVVSDSAPAVGALFRFTGRFVDPLTRKQWNLNRWYDGRTGRWLSQDPIGFNAGDPNLNRYVGNGPTNATDPSGLSSLPANASDLSGAQAAAIDTLPFPPDVGPDGQLTWPSLPGQMAANAAAARAIYDDWVPENPITLRPHPLPTDLSGRAGEIADYLRALNEIAQASEDARDDFFRRQAEGPQLRSYCPPVDSPCPELERNLKSGIPGMALIGPGGLIDVLPSRSGRGRGGKQPRLRQLGNDPNVSRADRGWIAQEINQINRGKRSSIRVPPGKVLAHKRGFEAKDGYDYSHSNLQDVDLHKLQHRHGGYR